MVRKKNTATKNKTQQYATKQIILQAARKVFSLYSYRSASIRMIGKESGFEHPLVSYYFPKKAELFEMVLKQICDEIYLANIEWFKGLEHIHFTESFGLYLSRMFDYHLQNPELLRILSLNIAQANDHDKIPGYQYIPNLIKKCRQTFIEKIQFSGNPNEVEMITNSFNALVIVLLGAKSCYAKVLGLEPDSLEYQNKVKDMLLYIFLPHIKKVAKKDSVSHGS